MITRFRFSVVLSLLLLALLGACGQKGPLTYPRQPAPAGEDAPAGDDESSLEDSAIEDHDNE